MLPCHQHHWGAYDLCTVHCIVVVVLHTHVPPVMLLPIFLGYAHTWQCHAPYLVRLTVFRAIVDGVHRLLVPANSLKHSLGVWECRGKKWYGHHANLTEAHTICEMPPLCGRIRQYLDSENEGTD